MKFKLQPYTIHELGQRKNQEDSIFPAHEKSTCNDRIFILCDGMGGHEKGEVASATVCETMSLAILSRWTPNEPLSDDFLLQAIEDAYDALDAKDNGEAKKMGTTMTFLCLHSEGATIAHIGDSRVYQLRPAKGDAPAEIIFKTRDHSLVNDLIKIGEITEEEAKNHPQKNVITRAMQPCQERRSKADIAHLTDIQPGDYFYLCSDGMLEQTSDENLLYIITKPKTSNEQKINMLIDVTKDNKDNHTAHLIYINKVDGTLSAAPVSSTSQSEEVTIMPSNSEGSQRPQGTWITPEEPAKKSKLPFIITTLIVLAAIAGGLYYFLFSSAEQEEIEEVDNAPVELIDKSPNIVNGGADNPENPSQQEGSDAEEEMGNTPTANEGDTVTATPPTEENMEQNKDTTKDSKKSTVDISKLTPKKPNINN